jgi:hypothetical protein
MAKRETPKDTYTTVQPGKDGRSQPQYATVGCARVDEERVVAGLVWLLRRTMKNGQHSLASQRSEADANAVDDAAEPRQEA